MRKTKSMLDDMVNRYATITGKNYHIHCAYGGYMLVLQKGNDIIDITPYLKAGELYTVLTSLINVQIYNSEVQ